METIGEELKNERILRNMTIKELSSKISKSSPYISMVENDKTKPTSDYLYNFSKAMFDKLKDEPAYLHVVAESYIKLCKKADVQIKKFEEVDNVLKKLGMHEAGEPTREPYYLLNWLLTQEDEEVVFGVGEAFDGEKELRYLEKEDVYTRNPKEFIFLDKKDKQFLLNVIAHYIESKYGDEVLDSDYAEFFWKFDLLERHDFDLLKYSQDDLEVLMTRFNKEED